MFLPPAFRSLPDASRQPYGQPGETAGSRPPARRRRLGLAGVVVAVRTAVVSSIAVLLLVGTAWVRQHIGDTFVVLAGASVSLVLLSEPAGGGAADPLPWLVTAVDGALTLTLIALTGGVYSPVVGVLALVVIASAARLSGRRDASAGRASGWLIRRPRLALTSGPAVVARPGASGRWWAVYLVFIATVAAALSALADASTGRGSAR